MNTVVWKFELRSATLCTIQMPEGASVLSVGIQDDVMVVWAAVDPDAAVVTDRTFLIVNTGRPAIPDLDRGRRFLGTVTSSTGIVWHVWE